MLTQMRSNLFGGILTLKAYTEIPDKIEKFLGCATQVCEQTEKLSILILIVCKLYLEARPI
jgi:hypothetical protein